MEMHTREQAIENADAFMAVWPWFNDWKIVGVFADSEVAGRVAGAMRGGRVLALYSLDADFHPIKMMPPTEGKDERRHRKG